MNDPLVISMLIAITIMLMILVSRKTQPITINDTPPKNYNQDKVTFQLALTDKDGNRISKWENANVKVQPGYPNPIRLALTAEITPFSYGTVEGIKSQISGVEYKLHPFDKPVYGAAKDTTININLDLDLES